MANISKKKGVQYSLTQGEGILYNKRPTNGITKATLHNTAYDVVDIIERTGVPIGVLDTTRYELHPMYSATTSCLATEEFDAEKGKDIAKRKVLTRYNGDKIDKIDLAIEDLEAIIKRLKRQKKIAEERRERDKKYLKKERKGELDKNEKGKLDKKDKDKNDKDDD